MLATQYFPCSKYFLIFMYQTFDLSLNTSLCFTVLFPDSDGLQLMVSLARTCCQQNARTGAMKVEKVITQKIVLSCHHSTGSGKAIGVWTRIFEDI